MKACLFGLLVVGIFLTAISPIAAADETQDEAQKRPKDNRRHVENYCP